jgi:hypothetical protein
MSKLMITLGIIIAAAGAVMGALIYVSPGQMQVLGLTPEVAAILLVGGFGLVGLGGVISAINRVAAGSPDDATETPESAPAASNEAASTVSEFSPVTASPPPFSVPTPVVESQPSVSKLDALIQESKAETSRAVAASKETVSSLDQAKDDLKAAFAGSPPEPPSPPPAEEVVEEPEDTQLYVVEERLIRGRPARVLSDGTVEAETDDGWMRFENLEHLEEYLDAMSPGQN